LEKDYLMPPRRKKTILIADDDLFYIMDLVDSMENEGYQVITAETGSEVIKKVRNRRGAVDVAILDIMMRWDKSAPASESGRATGLAVARRLKNLYPNISLVGFSVLNDLSIKNWFKRNGSGYLNKPVAARELLDVIYRALYKRARRKPKCFIVHGTDEKALKELKQFLRTDLGITESIVLREQPSLGRTIIEKFEDNAIAADLAFVLLTPDDIVSSEKNHQNTSRRARQNVIFELGYFYAQMQRKRGRVILLYKGNLELPSDISGIVYINISKGLKGTKKLLQEELKEWL
jgi:predicted nucleotide-binding protein